MLMLMVVVIMSVVSMAMALVVLMLVLMAVPIMRVMGFYMTLDFGLWTLDSPPGAPPLHEKHNPQRGNQEARRKTKPGVEHLRQDVIGGEKHHQAKQEDPYCVADRH